MPGSLQQRIDAAWQSLAAKVAALGDDAMLGALESALAEGVSLATFWQGVADGIYPPGIRPSPKAHRRWRYGELKEHRSSYSPAHPAAVSPSSKRPRGRPRKYPRVAAT
jgi:hypothetical protein